MIKIKKLLLGSIYTIIILNLLWLSFANWLQLKPIRNEVEILNSNQDSVISEIQDCDDPIKCWQYWIAKDIWITSSDNEITNSEEARTATMLYVKKIINYFLWLLWLLALIFLLYNWFLIVTAWWNDEKFKNGVKWLKYAAIAIIWVGLSLLFINFIFRIMIEKSWI